jgi:hypothetical protein
MTRATPPPPPFRPAPRPRAARPVSEADIVAAHLAGRDFNCPRCRYPLRDLAGNICPECGFEITRSRLMFGVAHWKRPPFFVGAAALLAAVLPGLWAAAVLLRAGSVMGRLGFADQLNLFVLFAWFVTLGKLGLSWINWSGSMAAWPRWRHWLTAGACWLLPALGGLIAWKMGTWR